MRAEEITTTNIFKENSNITIGTSNNSKFTSAFRNNTTWDKHLTGFVSKIMGKVGYKGRGLGKSEDGILKPITIKNTKVIGKENNQQVNI